MNINEFCGLDSYGKDISGKEMSHNEKFTAVVNKIGLEKCTSFIPATKEQIKMALVSDKHLNNIPLKLWDYASGYRDTGAGRCVPSHYGFRELMVRSGFTVISLSDCVCTLKTAAKMWADLEES